MNNITDTNSINNNMNDNKDNKRRQSIMILNVPDYVNDVIRTAFDLMYDETCSYLSSVHVLLSVITYIDNKDKILSKCGTTYAKMMTSYQYLAGAGDYGLDYGKDGDNPNRFLTDWVINFLANVQSAKVDNYESYFLKFLLDNRDEDLETYLNYVGVSLEKIISVNDKDFKIPAEIARFVVNQNEVVKEKNEETYELEDYVDQMINVLCRKTRKNPCLVGESGVGKTTAVDALVKRINSGDVPKRLKNVKVLSINSSALMSNTFLRGTFEAKLEALFNFAKKNKVILFMDEIHTFMSLGKGGGDDSQSAGNLIKQYLSSGEISIIGTTTNKEWHKYIESDAALKNRLQDINIKEPSIDETINIVKSSIKNYEKYHDLVVSDDAVVSAVKLSDRYMTSQKLPSKAFIVLDDACANVEIAHEKDKEKVVKVSDVEKVVSKITGVDVTKLNKSDFEKLKGLDDTLHKKIVGQENAVDKVVRAIKRGKVGVRDANKPVASFLFVGPTGVGKTLLCKIVSEQVYEKKESFIRIDMSEFSEKHSSSKLIGTAPGYVGYGQGGNLTERVKKNPNSLILLDEIEKADPQVFDIFLQVLDDGILTDGEGNTVDFKNCIIVMTSNAGYGVEQFKHSNMGFNANSELNTDDYNKREEIAKKELESTFRPEFLNRIDNIVIFDKITKEQAVDIAKLELNKVIDRLKEQDINVCFTEAVYNMIVDKGYSEKFGARNIIRAVQENILDEITDAIINEEMKAGKVYRVDYQNKRVTISEVMMSLNIGDGVLLNEYKYNIMNK